MAVPPATLAEAVDTSALMTGFAERILAGLANNVPSGVSRTDAVVELVKNIRWEPRPDRTPPAIVIMRRGSKKKGVSNVLAVISKTGEFADMYPSWEPVLKELQARKVANGVSRAKHDGLGFGGVPVAESEDK